MYVTVQHVRSPDGADGFNAYYHVHGSNVSLDWGSASTIEQVADSTPGRLISGSIAVYPGGNEVLSYLDVVAQDETPAKAIRGALSRFRSDAARPEDLVRPAVVDRIGVRFSLQGGLAGQEDKEFERLCDHASPLVDDPGSFSIPGKKPLRVLVSSGEEVVFELDEESARRLQQMQGGPVHRVSIRMSSKTQADFRAVYGSVVPHILPTLTGLSLESLATHGVTFVNMASKEKLDEWPRCAPLD